MRAAITGFFLPRADLDVKCLCRMSSSRKGCLHAVGSASSHGERPVIAIRHGRDSRIRVRLCWSSRCRLWQSAWSWVTTAIVSYGSTSAVDVKNHWRDSARGKR